MTTLTSFISDYRGLGRSVWFLAVAETLVWAGMFYLFAALLLHWEVDLAWSKTDLTVALTTALIVSGMSAPLAGWLIDRGHGRLLLSGSALGGGILVGLLTLVQEHWQFVALWFFMGFCMAGCFYEPCFAYLTRTRGAEARRAITLVTLLAGFAGTVSFPTANVLAELFGWRASALFFCLVICLVAAPLMWFGCDRPVPATPAPAASPGGGNGLGAVLRRPVFWLLAIAFTAIWLNHASLINHLLPLLSERGIPLETAVLAASCVGPMQVAGRIAMIMVERYVSMNVISAFTFVAIMISSVSLFAAGTVPWLLIGFIVFQGAGIGVTSITKPVVTAEMLGRENFGAVSGAMALPGILGSAVAPTLAALLWLVGGYDIVLAATFGFAVLGLVSFGLAVRTSRRAAPVVA
jgi:MFS family permease